MFFWSYFGVFRHSYHLSPPLFRALCMLLLQSDHHCCCGTLILSVLTKTTFQGYWGDHDPNNLSKSDIASSHCFSVENLGVSRVVLQASIFGFCKDQEVLHSETFFPKGISAFHLNEDIVLSSLALYALYVVVRAIRVYLDVESGIWGLWLQLILQEWYVHPGLRFVRRATWLSVLCLPGACGSIC